MPGMWRYRGMILKVFMGDACDGLRWQAAEKDRARHSDAAML
jgi:hypothetical protein